MKCLAARDVITPEVFNRAATADLQLRGRPGERDIELNLSPPALVVARKKLRDLSELRSLPLDIEQQRSISQRQRPFPGSIDLQQARIIHIQIGPERLCLQSNAPRIFGILPQREIGIR